MSTASAAPITAPAAIQPPSPPSGRTPVPGGSGAPGAGAGVDVEAIYPALKDTIERLVAQRVQAPKVVIEDACQVAWIRLIRHAARVRPAGVVGWLVYTARNEVCRELHRRRREVSLQERLERNPLVLLREPDPGRSGQLEQRVELLAVATLPERQRRIAWLHAVGLRYAEIGAVTGDSARTVERQLARGRQRLRAEAYG